MNAALRLLIWMQLVGWMRFVGRGLQTLRGALLVMVALCVFVPMILVAVVMPDAGGMPAEGLVRYGPAALLAYIVANLILTPSTHPVYFTPAEVQFLFSGPFSRRQKLLYKVVLSLLVSLPMTLFLGLVVRVKSGWPPGVLLGLLLISTFMMLFTIAIGLMISALGASLHTRSRWAAAAVTLALVGALTAYAGRATDWDTQRLAFAALDSPAWQILSWPLASFFEVLTARSWAALPVPLLVGLAVNGAVLLMIFGFDVAFEEQSAAGSAALYARIMQARGMQVNVEPLAGAETRKRFTLPAFPHLGGVGPVLWRQMLTAYRSMGRLALAGLLLGGMMAVPVLASAGAKEKGALVAATVGAAVWLSIFLPMLVPFDFRGDIDRMATLKTLPVAPWRLALGQILTPALLLTLAAWFALAGLAVASPGDREFCLGAA
ncbi:MAG: putative ABC exporter domain-containing protein, partial [Gemmataceae bacterium]